MFLQHFYVVFGLVVFTKANTNWSLPFVTFKLLLFKYTQNLHIICSKKIFFAWIQTWKTKAILWSCACKYIPNIYCNRFLQIVKIKEIAQPRMAPSQQLFFYFLPFQFFFIFFHSSFWKWAAGRNSRIHGWPMPRDAWKRWNWPTVRKKCILCVLFFLLAVIILGRYRTNFAK